MIITEYDILFKKYILNQNEQECIELVKKYDINMKCIMNDYNNNLLFMFICKNSYRKLISTILNKY